MNEPSSEIVVLDDPSALENTPDPVGAVLLACERAKALLELVLENGDIEYLTELKAQATALSIYARQKELGRAAYLAAAEIVRRAERGVAVAIRRGQASGEIETTEEARMRSLGEARAKKAGHDGSADSSSKPRPLDYASRSELSNSEGDIYDLADDVDDDTFEQALAEAREERNLSRANVIRKFRGDPKPSSDRPEHLRGTHHWNPNRIVAQTVRMSGLDDEVAEVLDYSSLDPSSLGVWIADLDKAIKSLNALKRRLKEQHRVHATH
jgi:hypothetical protein